MSITLGVENLQNNFHCSSPIYLSGILFLDSTGADLWDKNLELKVLIYDKTAVLALRAAVPEGYLGGALMKTWVRNAPMFPELYDVYWIRLVDFEEERIKWGPRVEIRAIPPKYRYRQDP